MVSQPNQLINSKHLQRFPETINQWCQTDPVKGHVAAGFHSNQARTHLIWIRCVLAWISLLSLLDQFDTTALNAPSVWFGRLHNHGEDC